MKTARPKHCSGCTLFHSAGRTTPTAANKKYNAWCCALGQAAEKAIGWCKTHQAKKVPNAKVSGVPPQD